MRIPAANPEAERGDLLRPGSYNVQIVGAKEVESKNGTPGIEISYACDVGEIREWLYLTEKARWRITGFLEATGLPAPEDAFDLDVSTLLTRTLRITIEDETYQGATHQRVKRHEPATRAPNIAPAPRAISVDDDLPF